MTVTEAWNWTDNGLILDYCWNKLRPGLMLEYHWIVVGLGFTLD